MHLVGLTGGIASGKSTVARRLVDVHGMDLIDADQIAREVVEPGQPVYEAIVGHFGGEVVAEDGMLDRSALGRMVFADPSQREALNALTHPAVRERISERLEAFANADRIVLLDVPLLVEAGVDRDYDAIIVVASYPETQMERLVQLRGMDAEEADRRIASQAPLDAKLAAATHVVWNEGSLSDLETAVDEVAQALKADPLT